MPTYKWNIENRLKIDQLWWSYELMKLDQTGTLLKELGYESCQVRSWSLMTQHPVSTSHVVVDWRWRIDVQSEPKSKLLYFVHIFAEYWPIFTIFISRLCKKFTT